jgi:hypothetical protein
MDLQSDSSLGTVNRGHADQRPSSRSETVASGSNSGTVGTTAALGLWALVIVTAHLAGQNLIDNGVQIRLEWPPLFARFDPRFSMRAIAVVLLSVFIIVSGPRLVFRLAFGHLLLAVTAVGALWAVALAWIDGIEALTAPLLNPLDYLHNLPLVGLSVGLLSNFP